MSFNTIQVFYPQAKAQFIEFLLNRINMYFDVISQTGSPEQKWTAADIDRMLEEFSAGNIIFPFSKPQLFTIAKWFRTAPKGELLKRFKDEELVQVLSEVTEGDNLREYVLELSKTLTAWDECPRGFSRGDQNREKDLANWVLTNLLNRDVGLEAENEVDPPILEDSPEEENKAEEVEEVQESTTEGLDLEEEASLEVPEDLEEEEEAEVEEIEVPPPKAKTPTPSKKITPPQPFTPPKGPVLVKLVNSLMEYMEPTKAPALQVVASQRNKLVKYATERLGNRESLEDYIKALTEQTIDVCDRGGDYKVKDIVEDALKKQKSMLRKPQSGK